MDFIFCWRELRKVTQALTLHYERKLYMIADRPANRRFIGKYLEVFQFPDGRIEIRVAGKALPYSVYNKLGQVDPVAIVDKKRLGHTLEVAKLVQAKRDSRTVDYIASGLDYRRLRLRAVNAPTLADCYRRPVPAVRERRHRGGQTEL